MEMRGEWKHSRCPRCSQDNEDEFHVLCWENEDATRIREEWYEAFGLWMTEQKTEPQLQRLLLSVCHGLFDDGEYMWEFTEPLPMTLAAAINNQQ